MDPRIEVIAPKKLIGMRMRTSLAADRTVELWRGFKSRVGEIEQRVNRDFLSMKAFEPPLPLGMAQDSIVEKWAAVEVSDDSQVPAGMESYDLSGGRYAVFIHRGPASTFGQTLHGIFAQWLPRSSYRLDAREHFEVLGDQYHPMDPQAQEEVWIPLE
jgi:AraC family transcriptional regulator